MTTERTYDGRHSSFPAKPGQRVNVINDSSKAVSVLLDYGRLGTVIFDAPIGSRIKLEVGIEGAPTIVVSDWEGPKLAENVVPIHERD